MTLMKMQVERILCPTDLSECSGAALEQAARLSTVLGARLMVASVMSPLPWVYPAQGGLASATVAADLFHVARVERQKELERLVQPYRERRFAIETRLVEGEPAAEIEALANAWPADLIVMGTHGYHGFERLVLGSVTEKVLHRAPCPVLTVRTAPAPNGPLFERILCAADLTAASSHTLSLALALAEEEVARLSLLHVVESLPGEGAGPLSVPEIGPLRSDLKAQAAERLRELAADAGAPGALEARVEFGTAWRKIVAEARNGHADLVVIGAHSHGPIGRLFLGGTANRVVREADCPVLVVRDTAHLARARGLLAAGGASRA